MTFKPSLVLLLFVSMVSLGAEPPPVTVTSSVPSGIASPGQEVSFTVQRTAQASTNGLTIAILREGRDKLCSEEMAATEQTHAVRFTPNTPNWFVCNVTSLTAGKTAKPVLVAAIGVIIEPDKIIPSAAEPEDFDAFWNGKKALLASHPATPRIWPVSDEQKKVRDWTSPAVADQQIAAAEKEGFQVVNVEIETPEARPFEGLYAYPTNAQPRSRPAIVCFHGASPIANVYSRSISRAVLETARKYNALVVDINAHGMLNDQPQAYYDALEKDIGAYAYQGLAEKGDREKYYFLGMYLRLMRGIDFLCSRPEWDGKHLICLGSSQGGGQALIAAGLDKRVSAVAAAVPALCDLSASLDGRAGCWPNPLPTWLKPDDGRLQRVANTVGYFDAANHVSRARAKFLIGAGLADPTCPASSIYAAYNRIPGEKQILLSPTGTHFTVDSFIAKQRDDFILSCTKE